MTHPDLAPAAIKSRLERGLACAINANTDKAERDAAYSGCQASLHFFRNGTPDEWNQAQVDGLSAVVQLLQLEGELDDEFRQELLGYIRTAIAACDA